MESANLASAEQSDAGVLQWRIEELLISRRRSIITVKLMGHDGVDWLTRYHKQVTYSGATAVTLMKALNTANLGTAGNSLNSRILNRLKTDGHLASNCTIVTTPEA